MNNNTGHQEQGHPETPTPIATLKATMVNGFERRDKGQDVNADISVKVGNAVESVRLYRSLDYNSQERPQPSITKVRADGLMAIATKMGIAIDWSEVIAAYEEFAKAELAKDKAVAIAERATAYNSSWVHAFVAAINALNDPSLAVSLNWTKESYVNEENYYYRDLAVNIAYKGESKQVSQDRNIWHAGSFEVQDREGHTRRYTKIPSVIKSIKEAIDYGIVAKAQNEAAKTASQNAFAAMQRLFPSETVKSEGGGTYEIILPGSYVRLRFSHSNAGQYRPYEVFGISGLNSAFKYAEFCTILNLAKAAAQRAVDEETARRAKYEADRAAAAKTTV